MKKPVIIVVCIILAALVTLTVETNERSEDLFEPGVKGFAPFEDKASKVSFEEVIKSWSEQGIELYLPKSLPEGLKPTCVWVETNSEGKMGAIALFIYDSQGKENISTAELVIEVTHRITIPFKSETAKGTFTKINNWDVYIDEDAPVAWKEYHDMYKTTSSIIIDVQIGQLNYWFRASPTLQLAEIIEMIENMEKTAVS